MQFKIRKYEPEDLDALANIYRNSILQLGKEFYTADQISAWSSFADETEAFARWVENACTFVASNQNNELLGFAGLEETGRISALFVAPKYIRQGIATALLTQLFEEARSRQIETISTEASEFSKPLFEKHGLTVTEVEHTQFKGVDFSRYVMKSPGSGVAQSNS